MSTPDPNPNPNPNPNLNLKPSVSVAVSRSIIVNASESPVTQPNTVKTPPSQPSTAPSYRAIAPIHRQHPYAHPLPIRHSNSVAGSPHQPHKDPSTLIYPFASSGRGFPTRPGKQNPSSVADPVVASPSGGYPPRPVYAYHHGQLGSNLDPMIQFMRASHPQTQQSPQLGSGHMKGVPHFLQPRVSLILKFWVFVQFLLFVNIRFFVRPKEICRLFCLVW